MTSLNKTLSASGIAYHRTGEGPLLLLIHGVGLCAESWAHYIDVLGDQFELIIIDLPGHGASAPMGQTFVEVAIQDYVVAIEDLIKELKLEKAVVCGHSLGALIAIELAANPNNQVQGLVALNAIHGRSDTALAAVQERANDLYASQAIIGVDHTIDRWFGKEPTGEMQGHAGRCTEWLNANSVAGYAKAYKTFASVRGPSQASLRNIRCPASFMTGELDPNSQPHMTEALADAVSGAKGKTVTSAAHMMPLTHAQPICNEIIEVANAQKCDHLEKIAVKNTPARVQP